MNFTGKNLALVHAGLIHALCDIRNEIATCPDVLEYADDLDDLDAEALQFQRLISRIEKKHPELKYTEDAQ